MRLPLMVRRRIITTIDILALAGLRATGARGTTGTFADVGRRVSEGADIVGHTPPAHPGATRAVRRPARGPRLVARRCSATPQHFAGGRVRKVGKALYSLTAARTTPEPYRWDRDPSSARRSDILTPPFRDIGRSIWPTSAMLRCRLDLEKTCGKSA